jgi:hypothetical protein
MDRVSDAVVAHLANSFLQDDDSARFARASWTMLHALRRAYRLKKDVPLRLAVRWAEPGGAINIPTAARPHRIVWMPAPSVAAGGSVGSSDSANSPSAAAAANSFAPLRVGVVVRVDVSAHDERRGQAELDRLPATVLRLRWAADRAEPPLHTLQLPPQLHELEFGGPCRESATGLRLPQSLTALRFSKFFNSPVAELQLRDSLRSLHFGDYFDQPMAALRLPPLLSELDLGGFSRSAADVPALPGALQRLRMGRMFDSPLEELRLQPAAEDSSARFGLPSSLTELTMGVRFNQPLDSVQWPDQLRTLRLGCQWDQSVECLQLPATLTRLDLNGCNQPLNWSNPPPALTQLALSCKWNHLGQQLRLPSSLTQMEMPSYYDHPMDGFELPDTIRSLTFTGIQPYHPLSALRMPAGLTELDISGYAGPPEGIRWPPSLIKLTARSHFVAAIGLLSDSLVELRLFDDDRHATRHQPLRLPLAEVCLPPRLQRLALAATGLPSLAGLRLPPSLTALALFGDFDAPLGDWSPPAGLLELQLGNKWNRPVGELRLPPRLEVLALGNFFNQPLDPLDLPPSLTELHFRCGEGDMDFFMSGARFTQPLSVLRLPPALRVLSLPAIGRFADEPPALLAPPAFLPSSLRELRVQPLAVRFDRLAAWDLPPRCVVHAALPVLPQWFIH